jgi:hypothetical protein
MFELSTERAAAVVGDLWPIELGEINPQSVPMAAHLSNDLERIASSANERPWAVNESGLTVQTVCGAN